MTLYQRRDLQNAQDIGEPAALPENLRGLADASLADLSAALDAEACQALGYTGQGFLPVADPEPSPQPRYLHKVIYKLRFTPQERMAIRAARSTDVIVDDLMDILDSAENIDLDSSVIIDGLAYLVGVGLLGPGRPAEVRA